jgi:hypothetical protein
MSDDNWLRQEFVRAQERSAQLPPYARPVMTGGRPPAYEVGYSHTTEKVDALSVVCPACKQRIRFDVFVESWARLDEEAVSRARISVPLVHACTGG